MLLSCLALQRFPACGGLFARAQSCRRVGTDADRQRYPDGLTKAALTVGSCGYNLS